MAGKLQFTLDDYQKAAIKWRKDLLMLPIIGIQDTLQYMTGRPGIRYKENVGTIYADAQFAPYKATRSGDVNLKLDFRTLETHFGNVVAKFEPNSAISTLLGSGATKGDGQMTTPTALHVLAQIAKGLSEHLNDAMWNGVRNANGDTTKDLFDGFDTITQKEITAGVISAENGNYMKISEEITDHNKETVDTFSLPGTMFTEYHCYYAGKPSHAFFEACCPTMLLKIPARAYDDLISRSHEFARWCLSMAQCQLYTYEIRELNLSGSVRDRYMTLMDHRPDIIRQVSLRTIAAYLGVSPQYLSTLRTKWLMKGGKD